ncbi:MAG: hypothetical protein AAF401_00175 [Pseudomonadota bacterium]
MVSVPDAPTRRRPARDRPGLRVRLKRTPLREMSAARAFKGGDIADAGRAPRYVLIFVLTTVALWSLIAAYLTFTPPSYTSGFTLILPGSGASATINLQEIGSASSGANSPYSSSHLSPTESYKKLMTTPRVLNRAALAAGLMEGQFPGPKIKLVDQTSLIMVSLSAGSPEGARDRAQALLDSFRDVLTELRANEIARREASYTSALDTYQSNVSTARRRVMDLQVTSELVSQNQFNSMVTDLEGLDARVKAATARLAQINARIMAMSATLNATPKIAAASLRLKADLEFQTLYGAYSDREAEVAEAQVTLGDAHPTLAEYRSAASGAEAEMLARGALITGLKVGVLRAQVDLAPTDQRAALLSQLIERAAERDGMAAELSELHAQADEQRGKVRELVEVAADLDARERDHQVAEAVFSSALARTDTSKTDLFASYPLTQLIEEPSLPMEPTSPRPVLAIAAGIAATIMVLIGLGVAWFRRPLIDKVIRQVAAG